MILDYKYNLIKIFAIVGVISIHIFLGSRFLFYDKFTLNWFLSIIIYTFSRVSVPLFFMVSGALLLNRKETISQVLHKRVGKICILLTFWSIFYYFFFKYYCLKTEKIDIFKAFFGQKPYLTYVFYLF